MAKLISQLCGKLQPAVCLLMGHVVAIFKITVLKGEFVQISQTFLAMPLYVTGPMKINHVSANYTELYCR